MTYLSPNLEQLFEIARSKKIINRMDNMISQIHREEMEIESLKKVLIPLWEKIVLNHGKFVLVKDNLHFGRENPSLHVIEIDDGEWGLSAGKAWVIEDQDGYLDGLCNVGQEVEEKEVDFNSWIEGVYFGKIGKNPYFSEAYFEIRGRKFLV